MDSTVYRTKELKAEVTDPKHGTVGWMRIGFEENHMWAEEVIFNGKGPFERGWKQARDFRMQKVDLKAANRRFYSFNPQLLREKIRARKKAAKFVW